MYGVVWCVFYEEVGGPADRYDADLVKWKRGRGGLACWVEERGGVEGNGMGWNGMASVYRFHMVV